MKTNTILSLLITFLFAISNNGLLAQVPSNDLIAGAITIDCNSGPYVGTTTDATDIDYPGMCGSTDANTAPGVWYTMIGIDRDITLSLCRGLNYDTQISVWSGSPGSLTCVDGNDQFCVDGSQVTFASTAATTYYIYVYGYGGETGDFLITVDCNRIVTNTSDMGPGSLRAAVTSAVDGDTIVFASNINTQAILLSSQITIDKDLTFLGNGIDNTIIDGSVGNDFRLIQVIANKTVNFEGITFQNGGSGSYTGEGAAIRTSGNLNILNCKFKTNNNNYIGNCIFQNAGDLKVVNSEFIENGLLGSGGNETVIWTQDANNCQIYQCIFAENDVDDFFEVSSFDAVSFVFSQNTMYNSDGNNLIILLGTGSHTISNNILNGTADILSLANGATVTSSHNFLEHADNELPSGAAGNIVGDPMFTSPSTGDLTLMTGSLAISAGDNSAIPDDIFDINKNGNTTEDIPQDYAGGARRCGTTVDIGAYEVNGTVTGTLTVTNTDDSGSGSLRDAVSCAAPGATITFDHSAGMVDDIIKLLSTITLDKNLTFLGVDSSKTIIDGSLGIDFSLFHLINEAELVFRDMSFINGGGPATSIGGAIRTITTFSNPDISALDIVSCSFINNIVNDKTEFGVTNGGAINSFKCNTRIVNSYFSGNEAGTCGAAIDHEQAFTLDIVNSTFVANKSKSCGAIFLAGSAIGNIVNCTFVDNEQTDPNSTTGGGAINVGGSSNLTAHNNIFRNNTAASGTGNDVRFFGAAISAHNNLLTDFADSGITLGANDNITGDPLFVDEAAGDYRLQPGSPCINTGDNSKIPTDVLDVDNDSDITEKVDIDGQGAVRQMDGIVDMGANELNGGDCETAVRLSCGDIMNGNASWQGDTPENIQDCTEAGSYNYFQTTWFRFTGTGDSIKLKVSDYNPQLPSGFTLEMHLYSGSCGTLSCEAGEYFEEPMADSISITTVVGTEYYLMLGIYDNASLDIGDYTISMECICGNDPLTYSPPQNFINGDVQFIVTDNTITADNIISASADITYDGEDAVLLNGGFEVKQGAVFLAKTDGCPP